MFFVACCYPLEQSFGFVQEMWLLKRLDTGYTLYLLSNGTYKIGVSPDHHDLPLDNKGTIDKSISRKHAVITLKYTEQEQNQLNGRPEISITDLGSRYGTFLNDGIESKTKVEAKHDFKLRENDIVKFGLQWNVWRLSYCPLMVLTSNLSHGVHAQLRDNVLKLGGQLVERWSSQCTHLTMCTITMNPKVVCALGQGIPVVTPEFWTSWFDTCSNVQTGSVITLPDPNNFLPPITELVLRNFGPSFAVNPERSTLFKGKTFVFPNTKQHSKLAAAITATGGKPENLCDTTLSLGQMCSEHVIVVQGLATELQSQDSGVTEKYNKLIGALSSMGKRAIPQAEIGLSVLYNSMTTQCNSAFLPQQLIRPRCDIASVAEAEKEILAPDTQDTQPIMMPEKHSMLSVTAKKRHRISIAESLETGQYLESTSQASRVSVGTGITFDHSDVDTYPAFKKPRTIISTNISSVGTGITFKDDDRYLSVPKPTQKTQPHEALKEESQSTATSQQTNISDDEKQDLFDFENTSNSKYMTQSPANTLKDSVKPRGQKRMIIEDDSDEEMERPVKFSKVTQNDDDLFNFDSSEAPKQTKTFESSTLQEPSSSKPLQHKSSATVETPKRAKTTDTTEPPKCVEPSTSKIRIKTFVSEDEPESSQQSQEESNEWIAVTAVKKERIENEQIENLLSEEVKVPNLIVRRAPLINLNQSLRSTTQQENSFNLGTNVKRFKKCLHPDIGDQMPSIISTMEMVHFGFRTGERVPDQDLHEDEPQPDIDWEFHDMSSKNYAANAKKGRTRL